MKIIGLTGGIGTGKSTVAGFLRELGAAYMDLDRTGHEVYQAGTPAHDELIDVFGSGILGNDREIEREKLAAIVFNDREALKKLNGIIHPAIDAVVTERLDGFRKSGAWVVILEAAAMLESGRSWQADEIWITMAPIPVVLERLRKRSGYSEEEALSRIHSQMSDRERRERADIIIETDCSLEELKQRVTAEWRKLLQRL